MTPTRLLGRCVRWGLATGAVAGLVIGMYVGVASGDGLGDGTLGSRIGVGLVMGLLGLVVGALLSAVPTIVLGLAVMRLATRRDTQPSTAQALERDIGVLGGVAVALLNVVALLLLASLDGWSKIGPELPLIVLGDACVIPMPWGARASIVAAWFGP